MPSKRDPMISKGSVQAMVELRHLSFSYTSWITFAVRIHKAIGQLSTLTSIKVKVLVRLPRDQ